ncbi:endolytic transglycosylase MltG [Ferruginibacter sp. HRS2-29]|uniref:endolytic transglycosylase MltG n=1 Tax=Ferruginibacter sp. HRS2-29 TaxID=2487334 RepID=UPI0020CF5067|nr:endolytic transglycosylase MltG [Ferruginibacter sp. HRS2-29]MCP9751190.1 endolytic transglycosylase MltG [Ferruginibacter sp. HRS2-29]
MKKILLIILLLVLVAAAFIGWNVFGPVVNVPDGKYLYIKTGSTYDDVKKQLVADKILSGTFFFDKLASQVKYAGNVKAGKYDLSNARSLYKLVRMLKSGSQSPVKLVINKLRTKEDLAGKIGKNFECDSTDVIHFLTSNDSLASFKLDTNTVMTAVIPNTYLFQWNGSFKKLLTRLQDEKNKFWTEERKAKAAAKGLTIEQVYTMASIVEEETLLPEDKLLIASTYINRIKKGMRLGADPTVKYAMRDFGLKRIYEKHLKFVSPYNTYLNSGLPPGPICTPSSKTIDAVLDAPQTNYFFFVAKPDLKGYSNFAETYEQHMVFAKAYQHALDSIELIRQKKRQAIP